LADALYEKGFFSAEELSDASIKDLIQIRGIGDEKAVKLIEAAKIYTEDLYATAKTPEETISEESVVSDDAATASETQKVSDEENIDAAPEEMSLPDEKETGKDSSVDSA
jgi:N utilization substance protein A